MLIDAHNHLQDPRFEGRQKEIIAEMKAAGIEAAVVNGTSESDWLAVQELTEAHPGFILPAFGLHPWKVAQRSTRWLTTLRQYLLKNPKASLGECGLDRWIKEPHFEDQKEVFQKQLSLATELDRPITIHCLKSWGPMMELLRERKNLPRMLFHSFNGSLEIARELIQQNSYFSISGYFLHPHKSGQREIFRHLPPERLLLETDAPDMRPPDFAISSPLDALNHPANLASISLRLLDEIQCSNNQLVKKENALKFFSQ